ncbi:MAG: PaaI family thioesterase [Hyphomonadaceae bacterium]
MSFDVSLMPFASTLGVEIVEASADRIVGKMLVRPELCTAGGILHGGAFMAFADSLGAVGAFLALSADARGTTTIESKTNFLGAAKVGTTVTGESTPVHSGKRTGVWQTKITSEDGKAVALVIQTQMVLS